jgi:23S rRNA (cytidine1920-2'-O)/16S rRNA (cytidine1409-2'-O)-methyltransferase
VTARTPDQYRYVSRGGIKLAHALDVFELDVKDMSCADLGCSVGGFTDCLLQRGAASVIAVDTAYGVLDYRLRIDDRVTVRERTNALHAQPPEDRVDLVVLDMGWTRQERCIPVALNWVKQSGRIITLIKPHYEVAGTADADALQHGLLPDQTAEALADRVYRAMPGLRVRPEQLTRSPIRGGGKRGSGPGNIEFLALLSPLGDR